MVRITACRVRLTRSVKRRAVGWRRTSTGAAMPSTLRSLTAPEELAPDRPIVPSPPVFADGERRHRHSIFSHLLSHDAIRSCLRRRCGSDARQSLTRVSIAKLANARCQIGKRPPLYQYDTRRIRVARVIELERFARWSAALSRHTLAGLASRAMRPKRNGDRALCACCVSATREAGRSHQPRFEASLSATSRG
jgi:hypothetical protein